MTDLLDTQVETGFDICQKMVNGNLCGIPLPLGHHPMRKYCDEHQPAASKPKAKKTESSDTPPRSVNINFKTPTAKKTKADTDGAAVKDGAEKMLGLLPLIFAMAGDIDCSETINNAVPQIAAQLGALAEYHPGLKKIFAPMESTGEAMAWVGNPRHFGTPQTIESQNGSNTCCVFHYGCGIGSKWRLRERHLR